MTAIDKATDRSAQRPALLYGVAAIAAHIGVAEEATRHLIRKGVLPAFKIGRTVCARPETIDAAIENIERSRPAAR